MAVIDSLEVDIQAKSESVNKSLDDLVRRLGLITEGISAIGQNKGLNDFAKKVVEATKGLSNIQNAAKGISSSITPEIQKTSKVLAFTARQFEGVKIKGPEFLEGESFRMGSAELDEAVRNYIQGLAKMGSAAETAIRKQADALTKINLKYAEQERVVEGLGNCMAEMTAIPTETEQFSSIKNQIYTLERGIEGAIKAREELLSKGFDLNSKAIENYTEKIRLWTKSLEEARQKQQELLDSGKAYQPVDMSGIAQSFEDESRRLLQVSAELQTAFESLNGKIQIANNAAANPKGFDTIRCSLSKLLDISKKNASAMGRVAVRLMGFSKAISGAAKGSQKMSVSLAGGFRTLLKYSLGLMGVRTLLRKLNSSIADGMSNLVQYSNETNASVSLLNNSLTQLKNASAAMAAPLLNAFAPAINQIIQLCIKATNAINQLFSALTGSSVWIRAKKVTDNYAESLSGASKAAKTTTLAIDELNIVGDDDGGAGNGVTAPEDMFETVGLDDNFKDIAERLKEMWENADFTELGAMLGVKLQSALDSINWEPIKASAEKIGKSIGTFINGAIETLGLADSIGRTIGEAINTGISGINSFLDNTHWDSVGIFMGEGLNGIVNIVDWEGLGHLFAENWNAIFEVIGNAAATFDWSNFALELSNGINTAISDFDWAGNGAGIGELVSGILNSINTFLENTDWIGIGSGISASVNSLFSSVNWKDAGKVFIGGLNSLISLIGTFISETDWYAIATDLMDMFVSAITNIDWGNIGSIISDTLIGLLDMALAIVGETDWGALIQDIYSGIGEAIENIELGEILLKITALAAELFTQIPSILAGIYSGQAEFIGSLFELIGLDGIAGFFKGIGDALADGGTWLKENLADPVINWVKELFGIHSPSTVFLEIGGFLMQGLLDGISSLVDKVISVFTKIKDKVINIWNTLKTKTSEIWGGIKDVIKTAINAIIGIVNGLVSGVVSGINGMIDALNSISFDIPDWVPMLGGKSFGLNIPNITAPQIPYLANGAVFRGGNPFLAVVNDQPYGKTNIEAPLDTIKQALREEMYAQDYSYENNSGNIRGMIREAVHEEVSYLVQALAPYLGDISQNTRETADKDMSVNIGDRDIARANQRGLKEMGWNLIT